MYEPIFASPVSPWFRWFAWRPVHTVDRGWRWMRPVWRRRVQKHHYLPGGGRDFWFQVAVSIPPAEPPGNTSVESATPPQKDEGD